MTSLEKRIQEILIHSPKSLIGTVIALMELAWERGNQLDHGCSFNYFDTSILDGMAPHRNKEPLR